MSIKSLCVFCGSRSGKNGKYLQDANKLGSLLARNNIKLIFGGGKVGLMGVTADSVIEHEGEVIGVIPEGLVSEEVAHYGVTQLHIVNSMHQRKELMYNLSDAFLALPGGFGTLDEFCEIFTWFQLGIHQKPIAFLNSDRYFDHLLNHFQFSVDEGFVDQSLMDKINVFDQVEELASFLNC